MLLALTEYQAALLVIAVLFVSFALISALVIPRSRPAFPASRLAVFMGVCVIFVGAQLTAVLVLAEKGEANEPATETTATETTPTETQTTTTETTTTAPTATTETTTTETTTTETTTTAPSSQGNPAAGKEVFLGSAGCAGCHTLADAASTGTVGPNLDQLKPSYDAVVKQVTNGGAIMPAFKDTLSTQQIQDVAAYVSSATGG